MSISAVLFDWDGTLVDTGDILLACWHSVTEEVLGYRYPVTEEERRTALSMRAAESFPRLSDDPEVVARLHTTFSGSYARLAPQYVSAHPGAADALRTLVAAGVKTGVVTSKTADRRLIDADLCRLIDDIDVIVTGDDVSRGKPDPEGILRALAVLGVEPSQAVYVGDGPVDVRAGRAAGLRTIGLTHGLHTREELEGVEPDIIIDDLGDLAAALIELSAHEHAPSGGPAAGETPPKENT